jgi:hypothetical protein
VDFVLDDFFPTRIACWLCIIYHFTAFIFLYETFLEFSDLNLWYEIFRAKTMECQVEKNEHFRRLLLYGFNRGSKAAGAAQNICAIYGEDSIAERTAQKWFACFKQGNFDASDIPHLGRPSDFNDYFLNALIHADTRQTTRVLASEMGCAHATIVRHLQSMGKVQKLGVRVPHILAKDNNLFCTTNFNFEVN